MFAATIYSLEGGKTLLLQSRAFDVSFDFVDTDEGKVVIEFHFRPPSAKEGQFLPLPFEVVKEIITQVLDPYFLIEYIFPQRSPEGSESKVVVYAQATDTEIFRDPKQLGPSIYNMFADYIAERSYDAWQTN